MVSTPVPLKEDADRIALIAGWWMRLAKTTKGAERYSPDDGQFHLSI
jgi:hypothetical protein